MYMAHCNPMDTGFSCTRVFSITPCELSLYVHNEVMTTNQLRFEPKGRCSMCRLWICCDSLGIFDHPS